MLTIFSHFSNKLNYFKRIQTRLKIYGHEIYVNGMGIIKKAYANYFFSL